MENDNVVKKALAVALAKSGHSDMDSFLKAKGLPTNVPLSSKEEEMLDESKKDIKKGRTSPVESKTYCDRTCQGALQSSVVPAPEKEEKKRLTPIWPIDPETTEEFYARLTLERKALAAKREAFLKTIDTPEHLAAIRASAIEAVSKMPTRYIPSSVATKKQEDKVEKREAKAKAKTEKKESGRQTRLGQTKLIDTLLKAGKTEKEIFNTVREKIPTYPADKLPKLIKLRQYHVKK